MLDFRSDGQPYVLTAERALQDVKQPTLVQLRKVVGDIGAAGGEATHVIADAGVYDSVGEHMELSGNVRIKNGRSTVLLRTAKFDFKSGVYGSDDPVEVQAGDGTTIFADRASALNHGQELSFEGHVRTRIVPQSEPKACGGSQKGLIHDIAISDSWMVGGDSRCAALFDRRRRRRRKGGRA